MKLASLVSKKTGLAASGLALMFAFGMVVARSGPLAPIQVTTTTAETATVTAALFGVGTVEARRSYFIGPTAAGRLRSVRVDVGDQVKAGQILAEIDPVDLDERLRSLEAAQSRARSSVLAAEAQRRDAEARRALADLNIRRYRDLGNRHFVSTSAVDIKQQEYTSAEAGLEAADANLASARQELARLQADQNALRQQRDNLLLLAPRDGLVTSRDAEPGSTVVAGQAVVRLIEPDSLWVKVRFDQGRSRGLAIGLAARVALRSDPSRPIDGQVVRIEPLSDSVTEERIAFVSLDRKPTSLNVGELAEVTVSTQPGEPLPTLPNAAVKNSTQGTGVWLLRDAQPEFIRVTPGDRSLDGRVQIRDGLQAGDRVIVHSERELSEGARVKVVDRLAGGRP